MKKRKILVTGGCGYIGSHVTRQLSEAGYDVVVWDNLSTGTAENLVHAETLFVGDIGDATQRARIFSEYRFDAVFHFAGSIVVPESVERPLDYYENNTVRSLELIRTSMASGVKYFVFSSTASVYGNTECHPLAEDYPTNPTNPYSRSKLMTEWILKDSAIVNGMRYVILRYFNVGGADPLGRMGQRSVRATHLIKVASEVATGQRGSVTLFGDDYATPDGTGVRDYIHVEDLASAHLAALRYLEGGGRSQTLNCGYGRGYSAREVVGEVCRQAGPMQVNLGARREGDVASLIADVQRIQNTLDWSPQHNSLGEIVKTALDWERKLARDQRMPA